ncbi:MAG: pilin [Patescibacteria group bacterium]
MKKKFIVLGSVLSFAPMLAFAQTVCTTNVGTIDWLLCRVGDLLNTVVPVLIALGVVYFIWGVVTYVVAGDEEAKKTGRDRMIYGIIGLVVIVSIWGLVSILKSTFNLSSSNPGTVQVPCIPIPPNVTC